MKMALSNDVFKGIDLNAPDAKGYTALHKSCLVGDWQTVGQLIDNGADASIADSQGRTPLWFAHLHMKAARAMASKELFKAGVIFADCPKDLLAMSDTRAKLIGKSIFEETAPAGAQS